MVCIFYFFQFYVTFYTFIESERYFFFIFIHARKSIFLFNDVCNNIVLILDR